MTITIEFNEKSKYAQTLLELIKLSKCARIVQSPYYQSFVSKIEASEKSKKEIVDPNNIYFDSTDTTEDEKYFSDLGEKPGKNLVCVVYTDEEV